MQNDIKRVIAYSTCSQLGYMFIAAGVGAYQASIFHLFTHAFFKALLFLGAGSVIHAMSRRAGHAQDGRHLAQIPVTYAVMWIGSLALAGISRLRRLLLEGRDPRGGLGRAHSGVASYGFFCGTHRRLPDRLLLLAAADHDLPRHAARRPTHAWSTCTRARR